MVFTILFSCRPDPHISYEDASAMLEKNIEDFETLARFFHIESSGYDFATVQNLESGYRLILGKNGHQTEHPIIDRSTIDALKCIHGKYDSVAKHHGAIYFYLRGSKKNGRESASGLVKGSDDSNVEAPYRWITRMEAEPIADGWTYFKY